MGRLSTATRVRHISVGEGVRSAYRPVRLIEEATLTVNAHGARIFSTSRLPGHDVELVNGFLLGEEIIKDKSEVRKASFCGGADASGTNLYNTLDVELSPTATIRLAAYQATATAQSCGVKAPSTPKPPMKPVSPLTLAADALVALPGQVKAKAAMWNKTGAGVQAAVVRGGRLSLVREDVTTLGAVDKLIGALLIDDQPTAGSLLFVGGSLAEGVVKHALRAGFSAISATGSPTATAVKLCKEAGAALVTDLDEGGFSLFNGSLA